MKLIFFLKFGKANSMGQCPIFARVTIAGTSFTVSTGKYILPERWKQTSGLRGPLRLEREKVLQNSLELFRLDVEKKHNDLKKLGFHDVEDLRKCLQKRNANKSASVKNIFKLHNEYFAKKVAAGERARASFQKYERAKDLLINYIRKYYGAGDYSAEKISSSFIANLETYLRYETNFKGQSGIKNNSVVKYIKMYKTVLNYAVELELINKNPFSSFKGKIIANDTVFLTRDELQRIQTVDFKIDRLNKVRDIFLFGCYTGYSPIDAMKLTNRNLIIDSNGDKWIKANRTKTKTKENVPVLPIVAELLSRYELGDRLLPNLSNQKMNAYLKEIADICKIDKHLTWYVARHTFATTVTLGNGIKLENVSAMMGHTNIKQTLHYAKILDENVMLDMRKLFDKFGGNENRL